MKRRVEERGVFFFDCVKRKKRKKERGKKSHRFRKSTLQRERSPALLCLFSLVLLLQHVTHTLSLSRGTRTPTASRGERGPSSTKPHFLSLAFVFSRPPPPAALEPSPFFFFKMADSNPASPLACLLDLTYRSAEAESDAGVVSALKEKVSGCSKCLPARGKREQRKHRFTRDDALFLKCVFHRKEKRETCRALWKTCFASCPRPLSGMFVPFPFAARHKREVIARLVKQSDRNRSPKRTILHLKTTINQNHFSPTLPRSTRSRRSCSAGT